MDIDTDEKDQAAAQPMDISVDILSRLIIPLKAKPVDTIKDIKATIARGERIPQRDQRLCFMGRELKDGRTLTDYMVEAGSTLVLSTKRKDLIPVRVEVMATRTSINLELLASESVAEVKGRISQRVGFPCGFGQKLLSRDCFDFLDPNKTIAEHSVTPGCTLLLCEWNMTVFVTTLTGKTFGVSVHRNATIDHLKVMITLSQGAPPDRQRLVFEGMRLEDSRTLLDYGIQNGSRVHLVARLRGGGHFLRLSVIFFKTIEFYREAFVHTVKVLDVKKQIQEKEGYLSEIQRLFYTRKGQNEVEMENDRFLSFYGVQLDTVDTIRMEVTSGRSCWQQRRGGASSNQRKRRADQSN